MLQKPSAPKGGIDFARLTARLKPCPDTSCSVIGFPGSSDGDRRSIARNGCATGSRAGAEALRVLALFCARLKACSPGLKSGASTDRKGTQAEAYATKPRGVFREEVGPSTSLRVNYSRALTRMGEKKEGLADERTDFGADLCQFRRRYCAFSLSSSPPPVEALNLVREDGAACRPGN